MLEEREIKELLDKAFSMLSKSYIPYSGFAVGAALLTNDGKIYTGCNIENASFTPTICAERTAIFKAVSEGVRDFKAIAIVGGKDRVVSDYTPPCGVCRQVMMEFCDPSKFLIITAKNKDEYKIDTLERYMPYGFGPSNL